MKEKVINGYYFSENGKIVIKIKDIQCIVKYNKSKIFLKNFHRIFIKDDIEDLIHSCKHLKQIDKNVFIDIEKMLSIYKNDYNEYEICLEGSFPVFLFEDECSEDLIKYFAYSLGEVVSEKVTTKTPVKKVAAKTPKKTQRKKVK